MGMTNYAYILQPPIVGWVVIAAVSPTEKLLVNPYPPPNLLPMAALWNLFEWGPEPRCDGEDRARYQHGQYLLSKTARRFVPSENSSDSE